ncbi:MAG: 3-hydroxyacyl-CoA dehydrogenase NAD-binding domain-containing protein [Chromatiales bacterium]|nr:3-hydroxyacyl-CoA dehydrogenase NAD-binding domain-containing protein [Chromatiales bacterium]
MDTHMHWTRDMDGIVWLHLDQQKSSVNTLSSEVLIELGRAIDEIAQTTPAGLVLLSDKPTGFIAGADVNEFSNIANAKEAESYIHQAHKILARIEGLPCATVAMITGFCLGGGLELALACRYRVAEDAPSTRIGFPEVKLGIFPGFGGSVRSIQKAGVLKAMPLMLSGRTLNARAAKKQGLVDLIVPKRQLVNGVKQLLLSRPAVAKANRWQRMLNHTPLRSVVAHYLTAQTRKQAKPEHYPAPFALIEHWKRTGDDPDKMYASEARSVSELICGSTSKNLVHVYQLQEKLKRLGSEAEGFKPQHVHVIGGGIMGGDIAAWCALRGMRVTLQDREAKYLTQAVARADQLFKKRLKNSYLVQAANDRLMPDLKGHGVSKADVVIEAIFEDIEAKQALYREIEPKLKEDALLATNTSSIPLETLAEVLESPGRFIGLHFFNPVAKMLLVEVVHRKEALPQQIDRACAFVKQIGKLPLPVKSSPGFLVNRILMPYLLEAVNLYDEGVQPEIIDRAALDFGMPMGPIELADTVGLDICLSVAEKLSQHYGNEVPDTLGRLVKQGALGRKSGQGFYTYDATGKRIGQKVASSPNLHQLADRMILRLLNESVACLNEQIVENEDLLDAGVIFGTGFAPFRGGPLHYIHQAGSEKMQLRLNQFEKQLGRRFAATHGWQAVV